MAHNLDESIALLELTPAALDALLRGLPASWTLNNEGGDTWDARGVVAHLANLERSDWMPRLHRIIEAGESLPFDPIDREAFRRDLEKSLSELLDEFSSLRSENLATLRALDLQPADFARRGYHPSLGVVTLSQLLATWAAHDLTHLHQITRIMAHQYREAVGPWIRYLGVMHCNGHGANA
jgi:hypothetical protein